jgi:hypothetical protein
MRISQYCDVVVSIAPRAMVNTYANQTVVATACEHRTVADKHGVAEKPVRHA